MSQVIVNLTVKESRCWDLNPQPPLYESGALPLSYIGESLLSVELTSFTIAGVVPTKPFTILLPHQPSTPTIRRTGRCVVRRPAVVNTATHFEESLPCPNLIV